jgi:hypothetical protein
LCYVTAAVLRASVHPLLASVMYCNRRSLVFYDIIILLVIILLLSVMMNGCGFSHWSYQVFHLRHLRGNWRCAFAATLRLSLFSYVLQLFISMPLCSHAKVPKVVLRVDRRCCLAAIERFFHPCHMICGFVVLRSTGLSARNSWFYKPR